MTMEKILIITDSSKHTVSGIATSIRQIIKILEATGNFKIRVIHPEEFTSIPMPSYPEYRLALLTKGQIGKIIKEENPDYIHIANEGTMGLAARLYCTSFKLKFTTSYYSHLPDYIELRFNSFKDMTYNYLRWFHNASQNTMVLTDSLKKELGLHRFKHLTVWPLGVDVEFFKHDNNFKLPPNLKKPIFAFLGRLAIEKNLKAFLECDLPGSKILIGDGPQRKALEDAYGDRALFVGYKTEAELVRHLSMCDVLVFPSKTDTFGVAMLEALACGIPVAAFNVPGPNDIITNGVDGYLGDDIVGNAIKCLDLNKEDCRDKALKYSWDNSIKIFKNNLVHM